MESDLIRKLSIGSDTSNQLHISVGSRMGGNKISHIVAEADNVYHIYISEDDKTFHPWKSIKNMPVIVEYNTRY